MGWSSGKSGPNVPQWQEPRGGKSGSSEAGAGFRGSRTGRTTSNRPGHHASRIILWGGIGGALVALLVVFLIPDAWPTPVVTLVLTGYDQFAPPNALAQEDDDLLEQLLVPRGAGSRDFRVERVGQPSDGPTSPSMAALRNGFLEAIDESLQATRTKAGDALIIYLSAHGATIDNQPVLLAPNFDPLDETTRGKGDQQCLYVSDLLAALKENVPDDVNKVVFLDANRVPFYWHLQDSRFDNAFCARLKDAVEAAQCPNLYVINSAAPGQIGWAAPELGGSVFGYYVARGLAGKADVDGSGITTLAELERYVRENVARWVEDNRNAHQEPILFGLNEAQEGNPQVPAIEIAYASSGGDLRVQGQGGSPQPLDDYVRERAGSSLAAIRGQQERLDALWQRHAELAPYGSSASDAGSSSDAPVYRRHPGKWARLELLLIRAEQYLFAGRAYQPSLQTALNDAEDILAELERLQDPIPALSFPLAEQAGVPDYHTDQQQFATLAEAESIAVTDLQRALGESGDAGAADGDAEPVERLFLRMLAKHLPEGGENGLARLVPLALRTRIEAERIAAPADVRAIPWSKHYLADESESRRRYEDRLFVGTDESLAGLEIEYERLATQYADAATITDQVASAYHVRDEALQILPLLAQHYLLSIHLAPAGDSSSSLAEARDRLHRLNELWADASRLSTMLLQANQGFPGQTLDLDEAREWVSSVQASLRSGPELGEEVADEEFKRRILVALQSPLLPRTTRVDRRADLLDRLRERATSPPVDVTSAGASQSAGPGATPSTLAAADLLGAFAYGHEAAEPDGLVTLDDLARLERDERFAASPHAYRTPHSEYTPTLFERSRYEQWVWHAQRALDDFWGPVPAGEDVTWSRPGATYYFEQAAAKFLSRAEALAGGLRDRRVALGPIPTPDALLQAADEGIRIDPPYGGLRPRDDNPLSVEVAADLPQGQAAVWVTPANEFKLVLAQEGSGSASNAPRFGLDLLRARQASSSSDLLKLKYEGPQYSDESKTAHVERLFRGHRWPSASMRIGGLGPHHDVVWTRAPIVAPRITVEGLAEQTPEIVFILDCSNSMAETIGGNRTDDPRLQKLTLAKGALKDVIDSLTDDSFRVMIMAYGLRYAKSEGQNAPHDRNGKPVTGEQLVQDVFTVVPWTEVNQVTKRRIKESIDANIDRPFGITPLYYSIFSGVQKVTAADGPKQIVVITDGEDTQDAYIQITKARVNHTSHTDVEDAVEAFAGDIRVDLLGFGVQDGRNLSRLARDLNGEYFAIRSNSDAEGRANLVRTIRSLIRPVQYTVRPAEGPRTAEASTISETNLGETWVVDDFLQTLPPHHRGSLFPVEREYSISVLDRRPAHAEVVLSGSEGLHLWFNRAAATEHSIEHRRYWARDTIAPVIEQRAVSGLVNPIYDAVQDKHLPQKCFIAPHASRRNEDGSVTFRVCVQNDNEFAFSHRPRHVWAEIRPKLERQGEEEWPVFPFYDLAFEENTPVPVLVFTVPGDQWRWREIDAQIKIWCSFQRVLETTQLPFDMRDSATELQKLDRVDKLPHVLFQVQNEPRTDTEPFKVVVYESHLQESPSLYTARVQMDPPPDSARHIYYVESNLVRHEFSFETPDVSVFEQPKLLITPRAEIERNAVAVDGREVNGRRIGPLEVRVH